MTPANCGGTQIAVVIFGMDQVGQLPEWLAALTLSLLQANGVVEFVVKTYWPPTATAAIDTNSTSEAPLSIVKVEAKMLDRLLLALHGTVARSSSRQHRWYVV